MSACISNRYLASGLRAQAAQSMAAAQQFSGWAKSDYYAAWDRVVWHWYDSAWACLTLAAYYETMARECRLEVRAALRQARRLERAS